MLFKIACALLWVLLGMILTIPVVLHSQEFLNPLEQREKGEEILEFTKSVKGLSIHKTRLAKFANSPNSTEFKKLFSLRLLAMINNPLELIELDKNEDLNSLRVRGGMGHLFRDKDQYLQLDFSHKKYFLYDLVWGPFFIIGTITKVDTPCYAPSFRVPAIKYEMSNLINMNTYYKADLSDKKIAFVTSPTHYVKSPAWLINYDAGSDDTWEGLNDVFIGMPIRHRFDVGSRVAVFLSGGPNNFNCLQALNNGDANWPSLKFPATGGRGFPVEGDYIVDVNRYFGQGDKISIEDVKTKITSVMDEVANWRK